MGTWGTGPFDNDTASDFVVGLMKNVRAVLQPPGNASLASVRDAYELARASIAIITSAAGSDILGGPPLDECLATLNFMRNDDPWLDGWRDPKAIRKSLDAEIFAVARAMGRPAKTAALIRTAQEAAQKAARPKRHRRKHRRVSVQLVKLHGKKHA